MKLSYGRRCGIFFWIVLGASACGGGGSSGGGGGNIPAFTISGTVTSLVGSGLVLQNNSAGDLAIHSPGAFQFSATLGNGTAYNVTVKTQPANPAQTCVVVNGTGVTAGANITNVSVNCTVNSYTLSGSVSGLRGTGLVLQNGSIDLAINADGSFAFPVPLVSGSAYNVTIKTQPINVHQTCVVSNASGAVINASVSNVTVNCSTNTYVVGGRVVGLSGAGLVLRNNGADVIAIDANGSFAFARAQASGSSYNVTIAAQPSNPPQRCTVDGSIGTVGGENVDSVAVRCVNTYTIGGTVRFMAGTGLVLTNENLDFLAVDGNGNFVFSTSVDSGATYDISIPIQPTSPSQTCDVANGRGVAAANVSNIVITCNTWTRQLGTATPDFGRAVATDSDGNVYAVGYTFGNFDGNILTAGNDIDLILIKLSPDGTRLWSRQLGSGGTIANGVATDNSGNVYVVGTTGGSLDGVTQHASFDIFTVKYDSAGNKLWIRQFGTFAWEEAVGVTTDSAGNVYVTGFGPGGADTGTAMLLVKYDDSGTEIWARLLPAAKPVNRPAGPYGNAEGRGIAIDGSGNLYVIGTTDGDVDGNTYAGPTSSGAITKDFFVTKYDSDGTKMWTRQLGTTENDVATGIATDIDGNAYVCGWTGGDLDGHLHGGSPGTPFSDLFIVKYDSSGAKLWSLQLPISMQSSPCSIATDSSNNVYVSGVTLTDLIGHSYAGINDLFFMKLGADGATIWVRQIGAGADQLGGITIDVSGNLFAVGSTAGNFDGINMGAVDVFVLKYGSNTLTNN